MRLTQRGLLFLLHMANEWLKTASQNANKPLPHSLINGIVIGEQLQISGIRPS